MPSVLPPLILGFITDRLRLSPIVGYLLAGFLDARSPLEGLGVSAISFEEEEVAKAMARPLVDEIE